MLIVRAFAGLAFLMVVIGATLFLAAGDMRYWQAWAFLVVFGVSVLAITLYLMAKDRALLERRVAAGPLAEKQTAQKLIQLVAGLVFIAIFVVSGLPSTRCSAQPSSTASIRRSISTTCSNASPTTRIAELLPWNVTINTPTIAPQA